MIRIEKIIAFSQDSHWLKSLELACQSLRLTLAENDPSEMMNPQPGEASSTVILLDNPNYANLIQMASPMVKNGWSYVIAITDRPDWREARAVLKQARVYDYWFKSYDVERIKEHLIILQHEDWAYHSRASERECVAHGNQGELSR